MSTHITEDIPRLLTGEASRDDALSAAEHLRSCPDCQQELVSAVVAHASLTSAHRFAPDVVSPPSLDGDDTGHRAEHDGSGEAERALPPMTSMFEKVRAEAELAAAKKQAAPRRHRLIAVAAAAVILIGGGVTAAEVATSSSSPSLSRQTVSLTAFDRGTHQADVTIVGNRKISINATKLPHLDPDHVYELWLTDKARANMWPVGTLNSGHETSFPTTKTLLAKYSNLEVSIQRTNQVHYSGISVLRGQYQD